MYFYTFVVSFSLFYPQNGRKLHTMTTTGGGTPCGLQQYNKYSNIIFSFVCALKAHTRKKINDIEELRPTERGRIADCVVYGTFNGFFVFVRAEKTKKRCSEGARARDGGRAGEDRRRDAGGMAGGVPAVLVVVVGAFLIKVYDCTAFEAVRGGGGGYFCTVSFLHRRRAWIGRDDGGRR
jgi:hypothetical protein